MLRHRHDLQRLTTQKTPPRPAPTRPIDAATVAVATVAVAWLVLGSPSAVRAINSGSLTSVTIIVGALSLANLSALVLATLAARSTARWLRAYVVAVLAVNAIASVTDQIGLADILYLILCTAAVCVVVISWRTFAASTSR